MKLVRFTCWSLAVLLIASLLAWAYRTELAELWVNRGLEARVAALLGPGAEVKGARWRDGMLRVEQVGLGGAGRPFERLDLAAVSVPVTLEDLRAGLRGQRQIEIAEATLTRAVAPAGPAGGRAGEPPPADIIIERFHSAAADGTGWSVHDVRLRALGGGGEWSLSATGGTLSAPGWPAMTLQRLSAALRGGRWEVGSFALQGEGGGAVGGSAFEGPDGRWNGEFSWQDLDASVFLGPEKSSFFVGRAAGDAVFKDGILRGRMSLSGAEMRGVPAVLKLASLFNGEDWAAVPWDKLEFEFARGPDGRVSFYNLDAHSPNGLIVRGEGVVGADVLSATLELGVRSQGRPWLTAFMPVLFRSNQDGHLWTTVRLGGTPQEPQEDLTPRVVAALSSVPARSAVEAAESAAQVPAGAVEAAGSLLRTLLGP